MRISDWSSDVCSSDLFLELEEIIDREIERRPGRERGRVDIYRTEQKTGEARLACRVLDQRDPRVDEGPERGSDAGEAEADPPHEQRAAADQRAVAERPDQRQRKAGDRRNRLRNDKGEGLTIV